MTRLFIILMLAAILLCGCTDATPQEDATSASSPTETMASEDMIAQRALRSISVDNAYADIAPMGGDLLLFGNNCLTVLDGQTMETVVTAEITGLPNPDSGRVRVRADAVAYFDAENKDMVFLGTNLKETMRLHLPEDLIGVACLSDEWDTIYYCTQSEIRALNMNTGVSHLVKEHVAQWQSVTGVFLEGTVIRCMEKTADGSFRTVLLSSLSGELWEEGDFLSNMESHREQYYLTIDHGSVTEMLFGTADGQPQNLWAKTEPTDIGLLPERYAFVTAAPEGDGTRVDYYDLSTGKRSASVMVKQRTILDVASGVEGVVWLLGENTICRWELAQSPTWDETVYTSQHNTRENPNTQAMAQMKIEAYRLAHKYGIEIIIGEDAADFTPWDYTFATEYIPQAYEKALVSLDAVLSQFPKNFFTQAAEKSVNKKMTIVLVRGIYGAPDKGTLASAGGSQYWKDGNLYMALQMGATLKQFFYHEMGHVIDTKVLSTSTAFYEWEKLNPADFQYDNDYIANQSREDDQYLTDADRCFIDSYAMSFAVEDRSRILEFASMPGNAHYFQTEVMQNKLQRVCNGIREAFDLQDDKHQFIWEQYLNT